MQSSDRFIASCRSWDDFWDRARTLSNVEKGVAFERLVQVYLKTAPDYRTKLQKVWLLPDVPIDVRRRLNLPGPRDEGIDLIARTRQGKFWAIQAKFRSERDQPLSRRALGTFTALAFNTCNDIALAVVAHTGSGPISKRHLYRDTREIGLDRWQSLDQEAWSLIIERLKGRPARPEPRSPKPHQRAAISAAKRHFIGGRAARGRLIMPCGTGKSLAAFWIAQALGAKSVLVAVPSLALIRHDFAETTAFRQVARTITALSTQDGRIADEFRAIERGRISSGKIVEIEGDVPLGLKIKIREFAEAISTRIWESVGRANWRNFEDARAFVHTLTLQNQAEWRDYCESGKKPPDIPSNPHLPYADEGWVSWGDWLGTGTVAFRFRQFRSFKQARSFVHRFGLNSINEWRKYCKSGKKPADLPSNPEHLYAKTGWAGWGDWLGTGRLRGSGWRTFSDARAFVRRLGLKSRVDWSKYIRAGKKPADIPAAPWLMYADDGWNGMGDWLGTGRRRATGWRTFKKARAFARSLGLNTVTEWQRYSKSGKKPADIPADPQGVYAEEGWYGWGDWLGTGRVSSQLLQFLSFKKAREFVHRLGLRSSAEWVGYCKSGKRPADIPASPEHVYAKTGWAGWGDWLGTGRIANRLRQHRPFNKARLFARSLGLKNREEWGKYCRSGKKPADIPATPWQTYADTGWSGLGDWIGK